MSRAYRIRISESVTRTVHVEDGLTFRLELLDVLGKERMTKLLEDELSELGFTQDGEHVMVKLVDDVRVEVDCETGQVTVRLVAENEVQRSVEQEVRVYDPEQGKQRAVAEAKQRMEREIDQVQAELQRKVTERLEARVGDIRRELDKVSTRVVAAALKERAAELGEIEEISEDEQTGNLLIRIRV